MDLHNIASVIADSDSRIVACCKKLGKLMSYEYGLRGLPINSEPNCIRMYIDGVIDGDQAESLPQKLSCQQARRIGYRFAKQCILHCGKEYYLYYLEGAI